MGNQIMNKASQSLKEKIKSCSDLKRSAVILTALYLIAFYSIFRANFNYLDDLGRKHSGYHGWLDWSRWFTQIFSNFLHADLYLADISPLPQWIACILMAAGGAVLLKIFGNGKKIGVISIIAASLAGVTPYFLGIISYKYDSPYMAFSFFVSVLPFLFYQKKKRIYMPVSCICLVLMCTSYQASSGIYPLLTLFLAARDINMGKKIRDGVRFVLTSVISYVVSLGGYWLILMRPNEASVFSWRQLLEGAFFQKYLIFISQINADFKMSWKILILLLGLTFVIAFVAGSRINRGVALILCIAELFLGSFFCLGINLFLDIEKYDARAMYGVGVFLSVMGISISFICAKWYWNVICMLLFWCFFTFSFSYGNALAVQQSYLDYRIQLVAGDLNSLDIMNTDRTKRVQIIGDIGLSPVIENMSEGFEMLNRLIPSEFSAGYWGEYYFMNYFDIPNIERSDENLDISQLPVLKNTMYHVIYGNEDSIVVALK